VPPNAWVYCELESRELLTFCLKRIKGMNKVKLIDAGFVWTEPHSRRLKVKITVQKEVFTSTILQQVFVIEFVVQMMQCPACAASFTDHTWQAVVQARQKVDHKRTFLYLEQLILKHSAHTNTIRIKEMPDGLDFYFGHRSHAAKFVDFLQAVTPLRYACRQQTRTHAPRIVSSSPGRHLQVQDVRAAGVARRQEQHLQLPLHLLGRDRAHLQGRPRVPSPEARPAAG
jgi:nonsense-mediated mRNA decay protein 3